MEGESAAAVTGGWIFFFVGVDGVDGFDGFAGFDGRWLRGEGSGMERVAEDASPGSRGTFRQPK
jgi:hypothetical protein